MSRSEGGRPKKPAAVRKPPPLLAPSSPLIDFCRSLPGTTEDIKWGADFVMSVGGKMYAGFDIDDPNLLGFKCDEADFERLTKRDGVIPAPYAARFGWVSVTRRGAIPAAELRQLLRKSYDLVVAKLPAKSRAAIAAAAPTPPRSASRTRRAP